MGSPLASALRAVGHEIVGIHAVSAASRERAQVMVPGVPLASVDDIVRTALFLASDVSSYLTGQSLNLSGGMITEV